MAKNSTYLDVSWFVIFLLLLQTGTPSNAKSMEMIKLRAGIPKKGGFTQFVNVVWDSRENKYRVSGYCMDVFNAVVNLLPFNVSLEIEPYVNESGESAGTYDSLLQQIPTKYDIVVGDITIVANRSKYVDFTLPYTESGVGMLVAAQHGRQQTMWIFVKPFSWELWLCIVIISMFIGTVILIMERNVLNAMPDEQGSPIRKQLSVITILWFPLSQAVLPERQLVAKNCSRFVLMAWLLLAIVLMQSYTANLTSILTLDQLQPSFLRVDDLKKGDYYVGYQEDSFVWDLLVQRLKFNPSKLREYNNISEYHHALKIGSKGGGVSAIMDEVPYLKVYLQKFGSNYMMSGPTYRTDGFGFALPLNSNLTAHFSRAILDVTESDFMSKLEEQYFGKNEDNYGQTSPSSPGTPSLTARSFAGLFVITVVATLLALLVTETVIWERPILMVKACSQRYLFRTATARSTSTRTSRAHPSPSPIPSPRPSPRVDSTDGIEAV